MKMGFHFPVVPLSDVPFENCGMQNKPVVLVVDDEPLVADTLAAILSQAGFETRSAYNGKAALNAARDTQPGFMLTDVQMPGMDGIELAMTVADEFPTCEILLFSGHATNADLAGARRAGYDFSLMEKPIHPAHLVTYIAEYFNGTGGQGKGAALMPLEMSRDRA